MGACLSKGPADGATAKTPSEARAALKQANSATSPGGATRAKSPRDAAAAQATAAASAWGGAALVEPDVEQSPFEKAALRGGQAEAQVLPTPTTEAAGANQQPDTTAAAGGAAATCDCCQPNRVLPSVTEAAPVASTSMTNSRPFGRPPTLAEAGPSLMECVPEPEYSAPYIPPAMSLHSAASTALYANAAPWVPLRRRAVIVASATWGKGRPSLNGCVVDANQLREVLQKNFCFAASDVVFLHDLQSEDALLPTRANIAAAAAWLLRGAAPGDSLFLSITAAALMGCDGWSADDNVSSLLGFSLADQKSDVSLQLHEQLRMALPPRCRLHFVLDTVSTVPPVDMSYAADIGPDGWPHWKGEQPAAAEEDEEEEEEGEEEEAGARNWAQSSEDGELASLRSGYLTPASTLSPAPSTASSSMGPGAAGGGESAEVLLFKGVISEMGGPGAKSTDAFMPSIGAITYSFTQAVRQGQYETYEALLRAMRYALKNGPQHYVHQPEMAASSKFNLRRPFTL